MNHFNCIYMYINKINNHKYIGQTKDFNKRHYQHVYHSNNEKRTREYYLPFHRAIRKYGIENFEVIILKENINTQCLLNFWESYYIEKYNCLSKENYNVASGGSNGNNFAGKTEEEMKEIKNKIGEKSKGRIHSEETKAKMSESRKGKNNHFYGKHHNKDTKDKISKIHKGKKRTKEDKEKQSKSITGKNNHNAKRVIQYNLQGDIIKIWDYIKQASEELNINKASISNCCRGKSKSAGGFIWKYEKDVIDNDN